MRAQGRPHLAPDSKEHDVAVELGQGLDRVFGRLAQHLLELLGILDPFDGHVAHMGAALVLCCFLARLLG